MRTCIAWMRLGFLSLIAAGALQAAAVDVTLTVDVQRVTGQIDERIYGHFLEHIYHSCNGGLWGDLVWNRSFEERQSTNVPPDIARGNPFRHWRLYGEGTVATDTNSPLNSYVCARLQGAAGEVGLAQTALHIRAGETYRGSFWVRGHAGAMVARLQDGTNRLAELKLPGPSGDWREVPIVFQPTADATNAALHVGFLGTGEVWLDQVSLMPASWLAEGGFRPDLLKAIADLRPPIIRWPGGSYVSTYRWTNGIGPQAQRRVGPKAMWDDRDVNSLGTDEFIALCRKVGAQPLIVVNINAYGTDESRLPYVQEACDWVEYCNGPATSIWGRVRAANGHPEPYGVKHWEIDNEVWKMKPEDYTRCVAQFAEAMKRVDPSLSITACGSGQLGKRWEEGDLGVIDQCAEKVDYLSVHVYENPDRFDTGIARAESFIQDRAKRIAGSKNPALKLFFSEWNAQSTDWRTGLYAGGILNAFERADVVGMATPALFLRHVSATKWDNALINFDERSWFPAPNYVVMKLWRDHYAPQRVGVEGDCGPLNLVATRTPAGERCNLKGVNPSSNAVAVQVRFTAPMKPVAATLELVAPGSLHARNSLAEPHAVRVVSASVAIMDDTIRFVMPPLSVGVVRVN